MDIEITITDDQIRNIKPQSLLSYDKGLRIGLILWISLIAILILSITAMFCFLPSLNANALKRKIISEAYANNTLAIIFDQCGESLLDKTIDNLMGDERVLIDYLLSYYNDFEYDTTLGFYFQLVHIDFNLTSEMKVELRQILNSFYKYLFGNHISIYTTSDPRLLDIAFKADESFMHRKNEIYNQAYQILDRLQINSDTLQLDAIIAINNYICKNKSYDLSYSGKDSLIDSFDDKGVCANYAIMFQVICLAAGIRCEYYSDHAHAWNRIHFSDDSTLFVDVTWNDTSIQTNKYLLKTEEEFKQTHEPALIKIYEERKKERTKK